VLDEQLGDRLKTVSALHIPIELREALLPLHGTAPTLPGAASARVPPTPGSSGQHPYLNGFCTGPIFAKYLLGAADPTISLARCSVSRIGLSGQCGPVLGESYHGRPGDLQDAEEGGEQPEITARLQGSQRELLQVLPEPIRLQV